MELTTLVLIVLVGLLFYYGSRKPDRYPPGPMRLPIIGTLWRSHWNQTLNITQRHLNMLKEYGNGKILGYFIMNQPAVHIGDYEMARDVFNKREASGRPDIDISRVRTHGKNRGLLLNEGQSWSAHRRFSLHHLRDLGLGKNSLESILLREVDAMVQHLDGLNARPTPVNSLFNVHILNVLWEIITGKRFEHDDPRMELIIRSLTLFLRSTMDLSGIISSHLGAVYQPLGGDLYKATLEARDQLTKLFQAEIDEHKATLDPKSPRDFLDMYLIKMAEDDEIAKEFDVWNLYATLQDLFLAGSETTSTTTEWAVLFLLRDRAILEKAQREIAAVVALGERVELHHRPQMPYVDAVLAETMRRSTVTPLAIPHRAMADMEVAGYRIPEGAWLHTNVYAIHYDEKHWGDPHNFRPERFMKDGKFVSDKHLIPFGIGKRVCMGESLARQESFLFLANLIHQFDITPPEGEGVPPLVFQQGVVQGSGPFRACFRRRV
ncbi:cytochrome P450 2L1-like [Amphibalanus amphitrite]|uniref:cytochrome P450 2L1-like n=1 Tax=Amphibalanus amphitrite TaxID=1232801 RepID=UPI001C900005|nr:cytochrome P450 2L1-like [Amphibalanus amphitrite]